MHIFADFADIFLNHWADRLSATPQEPCFHAEGDVLAHTKMVCEEIKKQAAFQAAADDLQEALYLAAMLHDIGKIHTTRQEDGRWVSTGHTRTGAAMARQFLWRHCNLCGTPEKQRMRETICNLIRYHAIPPYAIRQADPERMLRRIAANGVLVSHFNIALLCALAEADARGRICTDQDDLLERIALCRELALEAECYSAPYVFPTAHTSYSYLSGRNVSPAYPLYDDTWGEVILMSGLPGTGKDTWIQQKHPDLPVISLDDIRAELGISPLANQGFVVDVGTERARELLRKKQPFIWNATNITPQTRRRQIELFAEYHARVRIVYLETQWSEQLRRDAERAAAVCEPVISKMLEKLSPPEQAEAHTVEWYCV